MLSEKAKGKQRVVELSDAPESSGQREPSAKLLVIRFTEGIQDFNLQVEHKDTVRDVKRKVGPYTSCGVVSYAFPDSSCPTYSARTSLASHPLWSIVE